jgi:hypothetical protein
MMRCSPLALLNDDNCIIEDVSITNPNKICIDCNIVYVKSLRLALQGYNGPTIFTKAKEFAQTEEVKGVLNQVERREYRDITINKGWCLHGLYCAFMAITSFDNYEKAMEWIINQKGCDSDTNCCVAGGLLGAIFGLEKMKEELQTKENIEILLNADITAGPTPRPEQYTLRDFYDLMEQAHKLMTTKMLWALDPANYCEHYCLYPEFKAVPNKFVIWTGCKIQSGLNFTTKRLSRDYCYVMEFKDITRLKIEELLKVVKKMLPVFESDGEYLYVHPGKIIDESSDLSNCEMIVKKEENIQSIPLGQNYSFYIMEGETEWTELTNQ